MQLQQGLLLAAFALSGITLKTSDVLGERGNTSVSYLSAAASAVFFGLLMSESAFSSALILGIIVGVTLSRKVDKPNMIFGLVLTIIVAIYFEIAIPILWFLVVVALFTFIDEIGHERLSQRKGVSAFFFRYRLSLKLAMTILTSLSLVKVIYYIGFLCFDLSYDLINYLLKDIREKQSNPKRSP